MAEEKTVEEIAAEELAAKAAKDKDDEGQKLRSWLGRVEKTGQDNSTAMTALTESMQQITDLLQTRSTPNVANRDLLNTEFSEKLLGDKPMDAVMEAVNQGIDIRSEAKRNLSALKEKRLNSALEKVKEHPRMSEDVKKEAQAMVNNGVDPNTAVQMAVLRAENKHSNGILTQIKEKNPTVLEMLDPGNPKGVVKPEGKLPPTFEAACQRGIADGIFKDREEYIENMDPRTKASLGLE